MAYYGIAGNIRIGATIVAYLIALRIRNAELFNAIRRGSKEDHEAAIRFLEPLTTTIADGTYPFHDIQIAHMAAARERTALEEGDEQRLTQLLGRGNRVRDVAEVFRLYAARLDLNVA